MRHIWNSGSSRRQLVVSLVVLAVVMLVLAGCGGGAVAGGGQGNALPTPVPAENVGSAAKSAARDSFQATWDSYVRDAIAADNQLEAVKVSMRQRYEKPSITAQDTGGILKQTDFLVDRTKFNISSNNTASALADFDVKVTYLNGDTNTRHCKLQVAIEQNPDDKLWYVLNPAPLAVLSNCTG